jgi:hypothetical protein
LQCAEPRRLGRCPGLARPGCLTNYLLVLVLQGRQKYSRCRGCAARHTLVWAVSVLQSVSSCWWDSRSSVFSIFRLAVTRPHALSPASASLSILPCSIPPKLGHSTWCTLPLEPPTYNSSTMAHRVDRIRHFSDGKSAGYTYYPVLVIGAGESGIAMGCRLRQVLGCDQFRIFERRSALGGTWHTNQYPGIACDV